MFDALALHNTFCSKKLRGGIKQRTILQRQMVTKQTVYRQNVGTLQHAGVAQSVEQVIRNH